VSAAPFSIGASLTVVYTLHGDRRITASIRLSHLLAYPPCSLTECVSARCTSDFAVTVTSGHSRPRSGQPSPRPIVETDSDCRRVMSPGRQNDSRARDAPW